jgi:hypothetical protein
MGMVKQDDGWRSSIWPAASSPGESLVCRDKFSKESGKEDLGGGLSATFRLSTRYEPDTGATYGPGRPFWFDESTVGLKGNFGSLQMGRRVDAIYISSYQFDPWINCDRLVSPAWDFTFQAHQLVCGTCAQEFRQQFGEPLRHRSHTQFLTSPDCPKLRKSSRSTCPGPSLPQTCRTRRYTVHHSPSPPCGCRQSGSHHASPDRS